MSLSRFAACCALGVFSLTAVSQMGSSSAAAPAVGSMATPTAAFDSQLTLIEKSMMGAVKAMPADKFSFAPSQAIFANETMRFISQPPFGALSRPDRAERKHGA